MVREGNIVILETFFACLTNCLELTFLYILTKDNLQLCGSSLYSCSLVDYTEICTNQYMNRGLLFGLDNNIMTSEVHIELVTSWYTYNNFFNKCKAKLKMNLLSAPLTPSKQWPSPFIFQRYLSKNEHNVDVYSLSASL